MLLPSFLPSAFLSSFLSNLFSIFSVIWQRLRVFWDSTEDLVTNVSDEHTASIFRAEKHAQRENSGRRIRAEALSGLIDKAALGSDTCTERRLAYSSTTNMESFFLSSLTSTLSLEYFRGLYLILLIGH
jgi:hypothetical protein